MTKSQENMIEIHKAGGVIASGDWTRGSGNFVSKRAIPQHCEEMTVAEASNTLKGESAKALKKLIKARPRVQKVIAITDRRAANQIARA